MEMKEIINNEEEQLVQAEVAAVDEQEEMSCQWKDRIKAWFTVKHIVLLSVAFVLLIAAVVALSWLGNNWRTPIWSMERFYNKSAYYPEEYVQGDLNGLAEKEFKKYCRILKKSETYSDWREEYYENSEVANEELEIEWGDNYRIELKIDDKIELSKSERKAIRGDWQEMLDDVAGWLDEVEEEWDSSDWRDFANECDMELKDARKLIESCREICDSFGRVKISKCYSVTVKRITTGEELEEPIKKLKVIQL